MKYLLLFLSLPLYACQGYRYVPVPLPQIRDILRPVDQEEYYCLLDACKSIKRMHMTIADVRMSVDDAIQTSITLYLKNVDSVASLVLLKDLQNSKFEL